ncbi:MAG: FG-GAP repeat domain-containing protein, partial [Bradymonadaceae bacterium]
MISTRWILVLLLTVSLSAGCGGCDDTGGTEPGNSDDAGIVGDTPGESDDDTCVGPSCPGLPDGTHGDDEDVAPDAPLEPLCPSAQTCGSNCCETEELCIQNQCVVPGAECTHNLQCPDGQTCEPSLGRCLPLPAEECTFRPEGDVFDPVVFEAWRDDETTPLPQYNQVMMTPAVVDITGNGTPDIVFSTFAGGDYNGASVMRAVDGRTFETVFDLTEADKLVHGAGSLAIGDLDGDGRMEIVAIMVGGGLMAFDDHTTGWEVMWRTEEIFALSWDGAALADLNADGNVEVVAANRVFDAKTGRQLCVNHEVGAAPYNSVPIDLNGDGSLDVLAAAGAFHFRKNADGTYDCPTYWKYETSNPSFNAVGDFGTFTDDQALFGDRDGLPEIVRVHLGGSEQIQLINGRTGKTIWARNLPGEGHPHFSVAQCLGTNGAGAPTVADFNGDGRANIATA